MNSKIVTFHCIGTLEGGGAEKQYCYLMKALSSKGIISHSIIIKAGINYPLLLESGAKIHVLGVNSNYDPRILFYIIKLIFKYKPNIIECWQRPMDFFASVAAILTSTPFVAIERTNPKNFEGGFKGWIRSFITKYASALVSNSEIGRNYWESRLNKNAKTYRIPNIIPFDECEKAEKIETVKYIVSVGRLSESKNTLILIRAFSIVIKSIPSLKLFILGDGEQRKLCEDLVVELNLKDHVKFLGYISPPYDYVKNAALFISLSRLEGLPNSVIEAAALKVPLILSNIEPHKEIFDEGEAIFVPPNDYLKVALEINNFFEYLTSEQINGIVFRAYSKIANYKEKTIAEKYIECYNGVLGI